MTSYLPWDVIPLSIYGLGTAAIGCGFLWSSHHAKARAQLMKELPTTELSALRALCEGKSDANPPFVEIKAKVWVCVCVCVCRVSNQLIRKVAN
jgi:hypothetical protein